VNDGSYDIIDEISLGASPLLCCTHVQLKSNACVLDICACGATSGVVHVLLLAGSIIKGCAYPSRHSVWLMPSPLYAESC
jgi:hypothetical protein